MSTNVDKFNSPQDRYKSFNLIDLIDFNGSCLDINKVKVGGILFLDNKDKLLCNGLVGQFSCIITDIDRENDTLNLFCVGTNSDSKEDFCTIISVKASFIDDKHISFLDSVPGKEYSMIQKKCFDTTRVKVGDYFPLQVKNVNIKIDSKEESIAVDALVTSVSEDEIICTFLNPVKDDLDKIVSLSLTPNGVLNELAYFRT